MRRHPLYDSAQWIRNSIHPETAGQQRVYLITGANGSGKTTLITQVSKQYNPAWTGYKQIVRLPSSFF
jgi:ABC-type molybdenum transport system ATPase subunit/photorepair protein PhrA